MKFTNRPRRRNQKVRQLPRSCGRLRETKQRVNPLQRWLRN